MVLFLALSLIPLAGLATYVKDRFHQLQVNTAIDGLMNFVDAKQHGVIRFLGQNEKLAKELAAQVEATGPQSVQPLFASVVKTDVFRVEDHPFKDEITSGKRHIPTLQVYQAIDFVRNGVIEVSSDPTRVGQNWAQKVDLTPGYSDVYLVGDKPYLTFGAAARGGMVYVHADARMLTNIISGEIGNLEGKTGAFYLAGVGKTFDYYLTNRDNVMITESRVHQGALLQLKGSAFPFERTQHGAHDPACHDGTYATNAGGVTGCREAMGFYQSTDGRQMLGASMPFYESGWTIVVEQESAELLGPLTALQNKIWTIVALIVLMIVVVAFIVAWRIARPLRRVTRLGQKIATVELPALAGEFDAVATGDLTRSYQVTAEPVSIRRRDEIGQAAAALNAVIDRLRTTGQSFGTMVTGLRGLVGDVTKSANRLTVTSTEDGRQRAVVELASMVDGIAAGARRQADMIASARASTDETAATVNEARMVAEEGVAAAQIADEAMSAVRAGSHALSEAMGSLSRKSTEIGGIVDVITAIARQTNLLALNANIEAARAGEQGRGFAVVASEVRSLAEGSQDAAQKIGDLLREIQDETASLVSIVEEGDRRTSGGAEVVAQTREAFLRIGAAVRDITTRVHHIADATGEVATVADESSRSTQEIAYSVQEVAGTAQELQHIVSQFRVLPDVLRN